MDSEGLGRRVFIKDSMADTKVLTINNSARRFVNKTQRLFARLNTLQVMAIRHYQLEKMINLCWRVSKNTVSSGLPIDLKN